MAAKEQELATARAAATAAGDQLQQAQAQIAQLTSERDSLRQERDQAQAALAAARRRIAELESQARAPRAPTANPDVQRPQDPTVPPRTGNTRPAVPR